MPELGLEPAPLALELAQLVPELGLEPAQLALKLAQLVPELEMELKLVLVLVPVLQLSRATVATPQG